VARARRQAERHAGDPPAARLTRAEKRAVGDEARAMVGFAAADAATLDVRFVE
jgi:hypothetical protein